MFKNSDNRIVIVSNFPFQDRKARGRTQHKLWITLTQAMYNFIKEGDVMLLVSPQSWGSPSNKVLDIFKQNNVKYINFDTGKHFPTVGSSFSDYLIVKGTNDKSVTKLYINNQESDFSFSDKLLYIPSDVCKHSLSIHEKVIFSQEDKLDVEHDYVTCHNILLKKDDPSLSKTKTDKHIYPIFHTNRQIWFSSNKQEFLEQKKVMWGRSGYTLPFYDSGTKGCTDMGYFVRVDSEEQGHRLEKYLNTPLFQYIFNTAKWSGFGNEKVFKALPNIKEWDFTTDEELYEYFGLSKEEIDYFINYKKISKAQKSQQKAEVRSQERSDNYGEVFTPEPCVNEMYNRKEVPQDLWSEPSTVFIDPACGNGNFLIEVIKRKVANGSTIIEAVETTYGVDIMPDNVDECRYRILSYIHYNHPVHYGNAATRPVIMKALKNNIRLADSIQFEMEDIFSDKPSEELEAFRNSKRVNYVPNMQELREKYQIHLKAKSA